MGTKMSAMKKRDIAPTLANISSFQQERYVSRSTVELG
jgi:hypothetical protein